MAVYCAKIYKNSIFAVECRLWDEVLKFDFLAGKSFIVNALRLQTH